MFSRLGKRFLIALVLATVMAAIASIVAAETIDPQSTQAQYAWGENVGWINAEPSGNAGPGVTVSGLALTGYMWGENVGWINMNCSNNATCGTTGNYGVKNDGLGHLSGYAWGENIGWISFSCKNVPATCATTGSYGVTIDPATGLFSGKAWSENTGWIVFDYTTSAANRVKTADDGDGIAYPTDNCPFDSNVTQTNTDAANTAASRPGADILGDACDGDKDGDGYTATQEAAVVPAKSDLGYCQIMRADVDGDGQVSILDLTKAAKFFAQTFTLDPTMGVDTGIQRMNQDGDNKISILDLTKMAQVFTQHVTACP
jgi:hypothetical protein